jgi:hypothetical protein
LVLRPNDEDGQYGLPFDFGGWGSA